MAETESIEIKGNLTTDPEFFVRKNLKSGHEFTVCAFDLASDKFNNNEKITKYYHCQVTEEYFKKNIDLSNYQKGDFVSVSGTMRYWKNKNGNNMEIIMVKDTHSLKKSLKNEIKENEKTKEKKDDGIKKEDIRDEQVNL